MRAGGVRIQFGDAYLAFCSLVFIGRGDRTTPSNGIVLNLNLGDELRDSVCISSMDCSK